MNTRQLQATWFMAQAIGHNKTASDYRRRHVFIESVGGALKLTFTANTSDRWNGKIGVMPHVLTQWVDDFGAKEVTPVIKFLQAQEGCCPTLRPLNQGLV